MISSDHYTEIALVVDASGIVHAAGTLRNSIWYLTNGAGSWTRDRLSNPPGSDIDGELAIAGNGSALRVAFTRWADSGGFGFYAEGIYLVERDSGGWSAPASFGEPGGNSPSLHWRGGSLYVAYRESHPIDVVEEGDVFPIRFATNRTGSWVDVVVSPNGTDPSLALTGTGQARIVFGDDDGLMSGDGLRYAQQAPLPSTDFTVTMVPETTSYSGPYALAHDGARAHLVYGPESADGGLHYALRTLSGGWDEPVTLMADGSFSSVAVATDADNHVHVVATTRSDGVWYFTNRHGAWESRQLLLPAAADWFVGDCAIDVDPSGRAHMLFLGGEDRRSTSIWYAVSPAR